MRTKTVLAALTTLLATSLFTLGNAEAGMIKVFNNSQYEVVVGVVYTDGRKEIPVIIRRGSLNPGLGSPVKTVAKIRVVNTTPGIDPNKALLKEYLEPAPHLLKDYVVTVDWQSVVTVQAQEAKPARK